MTKIWLKGKFVDGNVAKVPITDRGYLYGDGVFETMRSYAGTVFMLNEHVSRLSAALKTLQIGSPCSGKKMKELIYRSLAVNKLDSAYIRVAVTRGEGRFGITYKDEFKPNLIIVAKPFEGYPAWMHEKGIKATVVDIRQNELSPLSRVKSLNFLPYILARFEAKEAGYDEAILLNTRGAVAEAATSNIFIVKNGQLVTPSLASGILPGITRQAIIAIARRLRIRVIERMVRPNELERADEVFLTNSIAEVIPVVRIGRRRVGTGLPGPFTRLLHLSYQKCVIQATVRR